ncbi:MAG TPA: gamma-glutamylcyclotransferase family protein [Candidatus Saccharimonadales bacterium]|nr:gamma-glutamylcyclotransferase family protein [Candidatus Saccharimonadales bacterium]
MNRNLFAYGALMFPDIVFALTGKRFKTEAALLQGYTVKKVKDEVYPGLIKSRGDTTQGVIIYGVDEAPYQIIATWETAQYLSVKERVIVDGQPLEAYLFVYADPNRLDGRWDKARFQKADLARYVREEIPAFLRNLQ